MAATYIHFLLSYCSNTHRTENLASEPRVSAQLSGSPHVHTVETAPAPPFPPLFPSCKTDTLSPLNTQPCPGARHPHSVSVGAPAPGTTQRLSCVWLISLGTVSSRLKHDVAGVRIFFLFRAEYFSTACGYASSPSMHPLVNTGCSHAQLL